MLKTCAEGQLAVVSNDVPASDQADVVVRGSFLRFLALGGDVEAPVHERGIQLIGAEIEGEFDLRGGVVTVPLSLRRCRFKEAIILAGATVRDLYLDESQVSSIAGDGLTANAVCLRNGFVATGAVRFMNLSASGFDCEGGRFEGQGEAALTLDTARIDGNLFLNNGFSSRGRVRLHRIRVTGHVSCTDGVFSNKGDYALSLDAAIIGGNLFFRRVKSVEGIVSLTGAQAGALCDDVTSWRAPVILDGFCYDRIDSGPTDAENRIRWLKLQRPEMHGDVFWPQPWEQAAKVLRTMGHPEEAKLILIEKQRELRRLRLIGRRPPPEGLSLGKKLLALLTVIPTNFVSRVGHRLYGALAGYGYRPMRTLAWMLGMWALSTTIYYWADDRGLFAPRAAGLLNDTNLSVCAAPPARWTRCPKLPSGYNTFDPAMFSLDAILPLVDLKQEADWAPVLRRGQGWRAWDGMIVRGTMWTEILFGWITSLLLASAVGRLVQKD